MFGDSSAKRIKKLEEAIGISDRLIPVPVMEGEEEPERLPENVVIAIDLGLLVGMTTGKVVAEGKCEDMSAMEIVQRAYATAFDTYLEATASAEEEKEGEHVEE